MIGKLLATVLRGRLIARALRTPHEHIEGYQNRYWLVQPRRWFPLGVQVQEILRSDDDRDMYDHPGPSISWILAGGCEEEVPISQSQHPALDRLPYGRHTKSRRLGDLVFRGAATRYRRFVLKDKAVWTVFVMWHGWQAWGFYRPDGWIWWRIYHQNWDALRWDEVKRYYRRLATERFVASLNDDDSRPLLAFIDANNEQYEPASTKMI